MPYKYATERENYGDYASGAVFYGLSGTPTFPVRLASEILQRCIAILKTDGKSGPFTVYDPCCGSAYLLSTLAYRHWKEIKALAGSDIDERALSLAEANLSLLTTEGLERRLAQIEQMWADYGKRSHQEALESAKRLKVQLRDHLTSHAIETRVFRADVTDVHALIDGLQGQPIDIVLTDIPYGQHSAWQVAHADPAWHMLDALRSVIPSTAVLSIASDKAQGIAHQDYRRVERFRLGKRQVTILRPDPVCRKT
jgi:hypothetical protein